MINLPAITNGTEKQIAWAEKIRAATIKGAQITLANRVIDEAKRADMLAHFMGIVANKVSTDAVAWIEEHKRLSDGRADGLIQSDGSIGGYADLIRALTVK